VIVGGRRTAGMALLVVALTAACNASARSGAGSPGPVPLGRTVSAGLGGGPATDAGVPPTRHVQLKPLYALTQQQIELSAHALRRRLDDLGVTATVRVLPGSIDVSTIDSALAVVLPAASLSGRVFLRQVVAYVPRAGIRDRHPSSQATADSVRAAVSILTNSASCPRAEAPRTALRYLIACDATRSEKYVLSRAYVDDSGVRGADAFEDDFHNWNVLLRLDRTGVNGWRKLVKQAYLAAGLHGRQCSMRGCPIVAAEADGMVQSTTEVAGSRAGSSFVLSLASRGAAKIFATAIRHPMLSPFVPLLG